MNVNVTRISIPAWSTIGYGVGTTDEGEEIAFIGDQRPMRHIGEALAAGETVSVDINEDQLVRIEVVPESGEVARNAD